MKATYNLVVDVLSVLQILAASQLYTAFASILSTTRRSCVQYYLVVIVVVLVKRVDIRSLLLNTGACSGYCPFKCLSYGENGIV